jgi:hypothetical protein
MKYESIYCKQIAVAVNSDYKKCIFLDPPQCFLHAVIRTQNIRLSINQCLSCYRKAWNCLSIDIFTYIVAPKGDTLGVDRGICEKRMELWVESSARDFVFYILCSSVLNYVTLFVSPEEGTSRPENLTILVVRVVGHLVLCIIFVFSLVSTF